MHLEPLPIDDVLPEVMTSLRENSSVVLRAPTQKTAYSLTIAVRFR